MGMGPIIWTCLALTVHQSAPPTYHMNSRKMELPLRLHDKNRTDIQQFILLYSADQGATWEQGASKRPGDPKQFTFSAPKDGTYWFLIQEVDRMGKTNPREPNRVKPSTVVVVDTTRPQIKVTAERLPSGEILAHWKAIDSYPDLHSLRLDYHSGARPETGWTPAGLPTTLEGEQKFACKDAGGEIRVRLRMKDQAGNEGEDVFVLPAAAASAAVPPPEGSAIALIPTTRSDPSAQPNRLTSQQTPRPLIEAPPGTMPTSPPSAVEVNGPTPSVPAPGGLPIAANQLGQTPRLSPDGMGETPARSAAVKIVKSREVRIDFTVGKVGPSGLGNADLYVTLDQGHSWKKMPGDLPISLLPGGDSHGPDVSGSVSVQLPAEGIIYGFIVAAKSKAGLAPVPPKPNDPPQALVEWDKTAPNGQLFKPQPDPSQPNTLLLTWEAKDRNMAEKPITLEWAEHKDGPWTAISEGLPNTSQYPWRLPEHLPPRVYLRLTMRDQAGNEARAQTDTPQLIDLSVPQTRIIGIAPASR